MSKKVAILLSTYNGEKYLKEQLDSIFNQTHKNLVVVVRDDGSKDSTCSILEEYASKYNLNWVSGENIGFALSFMNLLYNSPYADYYAFCDQDDVWHDNKIEVAISALENMNPKMPLLYTSNQNYINQNGDKIGIRFNSKPSVEFEERFMRGYFSGCTMVFNNTLRSLLANEGKKPSDDFIKKRWHDTWTLMVCLALGVVIYDPIAHMNYRRHNSNVTHTDISIVSKFKSILNIINDSSRKNLRSMTSSMLLQIYYDYLDENKIVFLKHISEYKATLKSRVKLAFDFNIPLTKPESRIEFILKVLFGWF